MHVKFSALKFMNVFRCLWASLVSYVSQFEFPQTKPQTKVDKFRNSNPRTRPTMASKSFDVTIGLCIHMKQSDYNHRFSTKRLWAAFIRKVSHQTIQLSTQRTPQHLPNSCTRFVIVWLAPSYMQINLSPALSVCCYFP